VEGHLLGRGGRSLYSPVKGLVSALAVELNPLGESAQVFGAAKDVATLSPEKHTLPNIVVGVQVPKYLLHRLSS